MNCRLPESVFGNKPLSLVSGARPIARRAYRDLQSSQLRSVLASGRIWALPENKRAIEAARRRATGLAQAHGQGAALPWLRNGLT